MLSQHSMMCNNIEKEQKTPEMPQSFEATTRESESSFYLTARLLK